jgi:hypothetical protein
MQAMIEQLFRRVDNGIAVHENSDDFWEDCGTLLTALLLTDENSHRVGATVICLTIYARSKGMAYETLLEKLGETGAEITKEAWRQFAEMQDVPFQANQGEKGVGC